MSVATIDVPTLVALIGVPLVICGTFLGAIYAIVNVLSSRIGDLLARLDGLETKVDAKFDQIETRLDGIGNTLVRFDERLRQIEDHAR
jgi:predicted PurR-regulated permease PerM